MEQEVANVKESWKVNLVVLIDGLIMFKLIWKSLFVDGRFFFVCTYLRDIKKWYSAMHYHQTHT